MPFSELDKFIIQLGREIQNDILAHQPNTDAEEGRLEG